MGGRVVVGPDAELVVEVMVLAGNSSPQDAVEAVVRDCTARGHRTEARVAADAPREDPDRMPRPPQG
jgi:Arc/MetJ family transcription regulator